MRASWRKAEEGVGGWFPWFGQGTPILRLQSPPLSAGRPLGPENNPSAPPRALLLYLLGNPSPALPFDDFSLVATKKCSYQQTDGG